MIKTLKLCVPIFAVAGLVTAPALADSNASGGGLINSETVSLGAGPFDHGAGAGDASNSVITGIGFTGGFNATHIGFSGTLTSVLAPTWATESDIQISQGGSSFAWQNPGPAGTYTTFDYDSSQELSGDFAGGVDAGAGAWQVEFLDTFDDGAGADSQSTNVSMTFQEFAALSDANGVFSLGSLAAGDSASSVGEFALSGLYDVFAITLAEGGLFDFSVDEDANGFVGSTVDTEIAIFDAAGNLVAQDDDGGNGLYSALLGLSLSAGDYTLAVASFLAGDSFLDGSVVNSGVGTGDYSLNVELSAVPVPAAVWLMGSALLGLFGMRRRA